MSFLLRQQVSSSRSLLFPSTSRIVSATSTRSLSKITIVGRLAAAPELSTTASARDVIKYTVATSNGPKDDRRTSWWRVSHFPREDSFKEFILSLGKGTMVYVEGNTYVNKYEDKDGHQKEALNISQRVLEVLDRRSQDSKDQEQDPSESREQDENSSEPER